TGGAPLPPPTAGTRRGGSAPAPPPLPRPAGQGGPSMPPPLPPPGGEKRARLAAATQPQKPKAERVTLLGLLVFVSPLSPRERPRRTSASLTFWGRGPKTVGGAPLNSLQRGGSGAPDDNGPKTEGGAPLNSLQRGGSGAPDEFWGRGPKTEGGAPLAGRERSSRR